MAAATKQTDLENPRSDIHIIINNTEVQDSLRTAVHLTLGFM